MRVMVLPAALALALAACGQQPEANSVRPDPPLGLNVTNDAEPAAPAQIAPAVVDRVRKQLREEPRIVDFVFDPALAVMLQVAVNDDGSRQWGYAEYLCMSLKDWGVDTSKAVVRVVDASKVAASNGNFRSISLGTVQCWDGQRWD